MARRRAMGWRAAAAVALTLPAAGEAQQPKTLRVVMHSDLRILDPICCATRSGPSARSMIPSRARSEDNAPRPVHRAGVPAA